MKQVPITPAQYHSLGFNRSKLPDIVAAGYVSASLLSKVRNPMRFLTSGEEKTTAKMHWGSLVDCLWTTPELFKQTYCMLPNDRPRRPTDIQINAKNPSQSTIDSIRWWNDWAKQSEGKIEISQDEYDEAMKAVAMLDRHPVARQIKDSSQKQVTLVGNAPECLNLPDGCKVKSMLDLLPMSGPYANSIPDLKTTNNLAENMIHNIMFTFDYVVKMAFYSIVAEAAGLGKRDRAILIWQRSEHPYDVVVRELPDIQFGKQVVLKRIEALKKMRMGVIDPYIDSEIKPLRLKDWAIQEYNAE